ncbi:hypothetical protein B2M26_07260 [Ferroacidibacillus organovorans]|uniref:Uncharacterized protein n=1 Tax=Ferroacidibacillus organovorans TaxID=1765683 RepID=A0A1V4ETP3_9BACL|nr:hypothetical protein B2M26_07260 [Ferroacidibacillus organovorans]
MQMHTAMIGDKNDSAPCREDGRTLKACLGSGESIYHTVRFLLNAYAIRVDGTARYAAEGTQICV